MEGATGPTAVEETEAALRPVTRESAVELMVSLAADSLVFPGQARRDRAHARWAAVKVVSVRGPGAEWFSSIDGSWESGRAWNPVTRHTLDGVVAVRGGDFVVALLQVGED